MRRWWAKAAAALEVTDDVPRTRFMRLPARWFGPARAVASSWFQDGSEPFPGHWRRFPEPWTIADPADPRVQDALDAALAELPDTLRAVVLARDGLGDDAAEVNRRMDLTPRQQRAILNRARARLREQLAARLAADEPQ